MNQHTWTKKDILDYAEMAIGLYKANIAMQKVGQFYSPEVTTPERNALAQLKAMAESAEVNCFCSICEKNINL